MFHHLFPFLLLAWIFPGTIYPSLELGLSSIAAALAWQRPFFRSFRRRLKEHVIEDLLLLPRRPCS